MAAKEMVWNVEVDNIPYKIVYKKNQVSVNNGEPMKLNKLQKTNGSRETNYTIPVESKELVLHIRQYAEPVLTMDGFNCSTGEEYVPVSIPKWVWIFVVLHAINFFLLIGGAIGGAIQGGVDWWMISVSSNQKRTTAVRVLSCLGIWLGATVVEFILAVFIVSVLG